MLAEAHAGILFRAPENVIRDFPTFPHVRELRAKSTAGVEDRVTRLAKI